MSFPGVPRGPGLLSAYGVQSKGLSEPMGFSRSCIHVSTFLYDAAAGRVAETVGGRAGGRQEGPRHLQR
eukprot:4693847-Pyramimonas_sp.AAC.1